MLACNLIHPNIVGGREIRMLQAVPVLTNRELNANRSYEPEEMVFHPVLHHPFSNINLSFVNTQGQERRLETVTPQDQIIVSLVFRPIRRQ